MAFIHNTQIIWPSTINIKLNSSLSPTPYLFSPCIPSDQQHDITINGSGNAGKFYGCYYTTPIISNPSTLIDNLTFQGSGGGNLGGNPEVIYVNFTGAFNIFPRSILSSTGCTITDIIAHSSLLEFTTLFQITISCGIANIKLINQYASVYINVKKYIFNTPDTFNIDIACVSVSSSKNTRFINIGQFQITFTFV
jgi:hypothetical protein